jgi:hypothetical protein
MPTGLRAHPPPGPLPLRRRRALCIYIFEADGVFAMIALHVDDIHVACNNSAWRVAFTALVRSMFDVKDQGDLSDIIGMHITRDREARTISLD